MVIAGRAGRGRSELMRSGIRAWSPTPLRSEGVGADAIEPRRSSMQDRITGELLGPRAIWRIFRNGHVPIVQMTRRAGGKATGK
jgi:hypothetical protein